MKIYGLVGFPLTHSFSKEYFSKKFTEEQLFDCRYENFELENINELINTIRINPEIIGINITIPYKQTVLKHLDEVDAIAAKIGAVNTIKIYRQQDNILLKGFNTDYIGFENSVRHMLQPHHKKALILGTGGSSNAIAYVLAAAGIEFIKFSREKSQEVMQYGELTPEIIKEYTLIINCTPLGMYPSLLASPDLPYELLTEKHLLYDLIYNPSETIFLKKGKERGATIKNGYEMLCIQAEASWLIWNDEI